MAQQAKRTIQALIVNAVPLQWFALNDVVMGGQSASTVEAVNGSVLFSGNLSRVGGGFCSARTADAPFGVPSNAAGVAISYESDDFCYKVTFTTGDLMSATNWQAALPRGGTSGSTEFIPFSAFRASSRGRPLPGAVLDVTQMTSVGVMCSIFADGSVIEDAPDGNFSFTLHSIDFTLEDDHSKSACGW